MGMQDFPEVTMAPDTFGLPEYKVSEMSGEIAGCGHDVRLVFGAKRFGQLNWLYTVVCSPEDLIKLAHRCEELAIEAHSIASLMERRRGH